MHAQKELIIRSHKITLNNGNILCSPTCSPPEAVYLIISGQYSLCTFHRWAAQANTFPFYKDFKHIGNTSIQVNYNLFLVFLLFCIGKIFIFCVMMRKQGFSDKQWRDIRRWRGALERVDLQIWIKMWRRWRGDTHYPQRSLWVEN